MEPGTLEKKSLPHILFVSILFGFIWGVMEVMAITMQGRSSALSDSFLSRLLILLCSVVVKIFISFILGTIAWLVSTVLDRIKRIRNVCKLPFLHYLIFICYFCAHYTLRILVPHGYRISLELGLLAGITVIVIMVVSYYFSKLLSHKTIVISATATSMAIILVLSSCIGNSFYYNKQVSICSTNDVGLENLKRDIKPNYNIIFIVVDALRRDHLHCFGYKRDNTPFIDRFLKNCIVFNSYRTVATETASSTASLFTGKHPSNTGVYKSGGYLNKNNVTIAEYFKSIGFKTALISANVLVTREFNFDQGFDYYSFENSAPASWIYDEFAKTLPELSSSRFFAYLHFMEPHTPYIIEDKFLKYFMNDDYIKEMPLKFGIYQSSNYGGFARDPFPERRYKTQGQYVALYDTAILQFDYYFQKIMELLKEKKLYDNTIVVFTSDHGEFMGDWNIFCTHGGFPYSPLTNIPIMIKYNNTYLEFDEVVENRNCSKIIIDLLRNTPDNPHDIYNVLAKYFRGYAFSEEGMLRRFSHGISLEDKKFKYIFNHNGVSIRRIFAFPDFFWPWRIRELVVARDYYNYLYKDQFYMLPDETKICLRSEKKYDFSKKVKEIITFGKRKTTKENISKDVQEMLESLGYIK